MDTKYFFKPRYIKEKYEKGYKGYRTLVLGVFHVCLCDCEFRDDCFKNTKKYDKECPEYKDRDEYYALSNSNEIEVESYLEQVHSHYSYGYITKYFYKTNKSVSEELKREFWDSVAFTNFLQNMHMSYQTLEYKKNKKMFNNNIPAFMTLLDELQPEVIYVIDKAVKDCLYANNISGLEYVDCNEDWQVPVYRFTYNIESKGTPEAILKPIEKEIVQKKIKVKGNLYRNLLENIYKIKDLTFSVKNSVSKEVKELLEPYVWEKEFIGFLMKKDVEIGLKIALRNKLVEEHTTKEKLNSDNKKEKKGKEELEEKYKVNIDIDSLINIIKTSDIPVYSDQYMRDGFMIELFEELDKCLAREEKMNQFNFMNVMGLQDISKCKTQEDWRTKRKPEYKGNKTYTNSDGEKEVVIKADGYPRETYKTNKEHLDEMVQNTMIKIKKSLLLAISS